MDLIDGMRAFSQVVASGSFTKAAERLGVSKKLVSKYVGQLEDRLGTRLLNRTTRSISLTEAGSIYHGRCVQLLDDLDEMEQTLHSNTAVPKGKLFISAPVTFGEMYLTEQLILFTEKYPEVTVDLRLNDRTVSLVDEGFDIALRIGRLENSSLIARKLAPSHMVLCASPDYLERFGMPEHPDELKDHRCIIDSNFRSGASWPFLVNGEETNKSVTGRITVNSARAALDFALKGGGITYSPTFVAGEEIVRGNLVAVLGDYISYDTNIYAVYNNNRNLAPKVRVFVDFLAAAMSGLE